MCYSCYVLKTETQKEKERKNMTTATRIEGHPISDAIESWSYNPRTMALTVRFTAGNAFRYRQVPEDVVMRLKRTRGSVGRLFNRLIKPNYSGSRVALRG